MYDCRQVRECGDCYDEVGRCRKCCLRRVLKQAFALQGKQAPPEVPSPLKSIVRGARLRKGQSGAGGSWKQGPADDRKAKRKGAAGVGGGAVDYSVPTMMTPPDLGTQEREL
jgi:hypothetical protein